MITAASFSNMSKTKFKSLYVGIIRGKMGLSLFYLLLMLTLYPLMYLLEVLSVEPAMPNVHHFYGNGAAYSGFTGFSLTMLCIIMPILLGTTLFSYLHDKRATDVFHSLPVRRENLFAAHYLAGLTILWVPIILSFLLVLMTAAGNQWVYYGNFYPLRIVQEMLCWLVISGVIFTITCLTCVLSGTGFDSAVLALAMGGAVPVVLMVIRTTMESLLLGFNGFDETSLMDWSNMAFFSPFTTMIFRMAREVPTSPGDSFGYHDSYNEMMFQRSDTAVLCWLLVMLVLVILAAWLYKRRKSELAGRTTTASPLTKIIQYAATFVGGGLFGLILCSVFDESESMYLLGVLVGGCIAFTAIEAVLARGFKTFPKAFLHLFLSVGVSAVFAGLMMTGFLGFEGRIPAQEDIQSVQITYYGRYDTQRTQEEPVTLTDPQAIAIVRQFHQEAYSQLKSGEIPWERESSLYPIITYQLKDGSNLTRRYRSVSTQTAALLLPLDNLEEFKRQSNPAYHAAADTMYNLFLVDPLGGEGVSLPFDEEQRQGLLEALRADVSRETTEDIANAGRAVCYLSWNVIGNDFPAVEYRGDEPKWLYNSSNLMITEKYGATLAFLRENGLAEQLMVLEERFSPQTAKIERAAVFQGSYRLWNRNKAGIAYADLQEYREEEQGVFRDAGQAMRGYLVADEADIAALYAAACHQVYSPNDDGLQIYFDIEGLDYALLLFVPRENAPELVEKYQIYKEETDEALPLAAAAASTAAVLTVVE